MKILTLDSNTDALTTRSSQYRREKIYATHFVAHEVTHFDAAPPPLLRERVRAEARKPGIQLITGAGHGQESRAYMGNSSDVLYQVDDYDAEEVSGKIVHLLSCGVGGELGPNMVEKGCRAFFGYSEDFTLMEEAADIFLECDSAIDIGLIQGLTAGEVYEQVVALFNQRIEELRQQQQHYVANWLLFNLKGLCAPSRNPPDKPNKWGDVNARL